MTNDVSVIIRSVGERTEALCKKIILEQSVPEENVVIVKEAPFSAAMKKSFQIGLERGLPWTFCVDADVLLRPHSIIQLLGIADKQKENVIEIQGLVLDKFFGGPRPAGNHLYRTNYLDKLIGMIPTEGINIRPETYMLNKMKKEGFPWAQFPVLVGIHDFKQYNRDIFRKSFVQAHKHISWMEVYIPYWRRMLQEDSDYKVAYSGLVSGIKYLGDVYIDINQPTYQKDFTISGFKEKQGLDVEKHSIECIEKIIDEWEEPIEYIKKRPDKFVIKNDNAYSKKNNIKKQNFNNKLNKLGYLKFVLWVFGRLLVKVGTSICYKYNNVR